MARKNFHKAAGPTRSVESLLETVGRKLPQLRSFKHGTIVLRLADETSHFCFKCSEAGVDVLRDEPIEGAPSIEIIGKSRDIQGVLSGAHDARARFFAGAFRVRGDLRYFSDLALELGILKEPL